MLVLGIVVIVLAVALSIFVGAYSKARDERDNYSKKYTTALYEIGETRADRNAIEAKIIYKEKVIDELTAENKRLETVLQSISVKVDIPEKTEMFSMHTNIFRAMDFREITKLKSDQYILQQYCMTRHNGIRALVDGDDLYYCAALGGAFGYVIGDAWRVTLRNGYEFKVILAEFKHPIPQTPEELEAAKTDYGDPDYSYLSPKDENGRYVRDSLNVVEFIVDIDAIPENARAAGTMSTIPAFGGLYSYDGDIVEMKHLGRVWEP